MNINQLETFLLVADYLSFSKAAEKLYISPTGVIKQINSLENSLDVQLFYRSRHGLRLTDAGRYMQNEARKIIRQHDDLLKQLKKLSYAEQRTIRVGISLITSIDFSGQLFEQIRTKLIDINFEMITYNNSPKEALHILEHLGEDIDVIFTVNDPVVSADRKCKALEFSKQKIQLAVPVDSLLAKKDVVSLSDLNHKNLMMIYRGWNSEMDRFRDKIEQEYPLIHIIDFDFYQVDVFNECARNGDCIITANNASINPRLKLVETDWGNALTYGVLYNPKPSLLVQEMLTAIKDIYHLDDE